MFSSSQYMEPVFLFNFFLTQSSHTQWPLTPEPWAGPFPTRPGQSCPRFLLNENRCCHALWMGKKQENKSTWYRFHEIHLDSLCSKPAAERHLSTLCVSNSLWLGAPLGPRGQELTCIVLPQRTNSSTVGLAWVAAFDSKGRSVQYQPQLSMEFPEKSYSKTL